MKNYKIKICKVCDKEYVPTSPKQKYCPKCEIFADNQVSKKYRLIHRELLNQKGKQYYKLHEKQVKENHRQYDKTHPERIKELHLKEPNRKETLRKAYKKYAASPKGRIVDRKKQDKRQRNLDFIPLNEYFKDSVAHHFDQSYVGYMDRKDHESISHNVFTGKNMDIINALAFNYLGG